MRASRILPLARTSRWAMVGSATRKARAISAVDRPPRRRSVSATCAERPIDGWQQVKIRRRRSSRTGPSSGGSARACSSAAWAWRSAREASRRSRSIARLRAVVMIQPAGLGGGPVAGQRSTATANASWTASSATAMSPKTRTRTATGWPYSSRKTRSTSTAALQREPLSWKGRTSIGRPVARASLVPQPSAASRSAASTIEKPPMYSLLSMNGPSVVRTSSSLTRTTVAVLGACSPAANTHAPASFISWLSASTSAMTLSRSTSGGGVWLGWKTVSRYCGISGLLSVAVTLYTNGGGRDRQAGLGGGAAPHAEPAQAAVQAGARRVGLACGEHDHRAAARPQRGARLVEVALHGLQLAHHADPPLTVAGRL